MPKHPDPEITFWFHRGPLVSNTSGRYEQTCKMCEYYIPGGRPEQCRKHIDEHTSRGEWIAPPEEIPPRGGKPRRKGPSPTEPEGRASGGPTKKRRRQARPQPEDTSSTSPRSSQDSLAVAAPSHTSNNSASPQQPLPAFTAPSAAQASSSLPVLPPTDLFDNQTLSWGLVDTTTMGPTMPFTAAPAAPSLLRPRKGSMNLGLIPIATGDIPFTTTAAATDMGGMNMGFMPTNHMGTGRMPIPMNEWATTNTSGMGMGTGMGTDMDFNPMSMPAMPCNMGTGGMTMSMPVNEWATTTTTTNNMGGMDMGMPMNMDFTSMSMPAIPYNMATGGTPMPMPMQFNNNVVPPTSSSSVSPWGDVPMPMSSVPSMPAIDPTLTLDPTLTGGSSMMGDQFYGVGAGAGAGAGGDQYGMFNGEPLWLGQTPYEGV